MNPSQKPQAAKATKSGRKAGAPEKPVQQNTKENRLSVEFEDGRLAEVAYDLQKGSLCYLLYNPENESVTQVTTLTDGRKRFKLPKLAQTLATPNSSVKSGSIYVPTEAAEYGSHEELFDSVRQFIHKYVQLPDGYETLATQYVFFTWVYDRFEEVPYLHIRSRQFGKGKSRALNSIGLLCYRPTVTSGGSTPASMRRIVHVSKGTLICDESDMDRRSDLTSTLTKILNQGFQKGNTMTLCRTEDNAPEIFEVFGPKVLVTREDFDDNALRSRCLEIPMKGMTRKDIPRNLDKEFQSQALDLRNKLTLWRFRNFHLTSLDPTQQVEELEDRLNQIGIPLLSTVRDKSIRDDIVGVLRQSQEDIIVEKSQSLEAYLVRELHALWVIGGSTGIKVKHLANVANEWLEDDTGSRNVGRFSPRKVGDFLRKDLGFTTAKGTDGLYFVVRDLRKLDELLDDHDLGHLKETPAEKVQKSGSQKIPEKGGHNPSCNKELHADPDIRTSRTSSGRPPQPESPSSKDSGTRPSSGIREAWKSLDAKKPDTPPEQGSDKSQ